MTDETTVAEQAAPAPAATEKIEQTKTEAVRDLDAPIEVRAEPAVDETATETDQPEGEEDSPDKPKPLTRYQRLQRTKARLATMVAEREAEIERLKAATPAKDTDSEPKEADYNGDWTKYQADYAAWKTTKSIRADRDAEKQQQKAAALQERISEANDEFLERVEDLKPRLPNFDKVMDAFEKSGGKFAPHVIEEIRDSDKGPVLAYHLAQNPGLVAELNALSPRDAAREIGRLEAKTALPQAKKQTQAPAPLVTVRGGASPSVTLENASMDDYVKLRKADKD